MALLKKEQAEIQELENRARMWAALERLFDTSSALCEFAKVHLEAEAKKDARR